MITAIKTTTTTNTPPQIIEAHPHLAHTHSRLRVPQADDIVAGARDDPLSDDIEATDWPLVLAEALLE